MPSKRLSKAALEKIRADVAWLGRPADPNRCWCHHAKCIKESGHVIGECPNPPTSKLFHFQWVHFCDRCREYQDGAKQPVTMTTRDYSR